MNKLRKVIEDFAEYLEYTIENATQSHGKLLLPWLHEERNYIAQLAAAAYTTAVSHGHLQCGRALVLCQAADLAIEQHYAPEFQAEAIVEMVPLLASTIIVRCLLAGRGSEYNAAIAIHFQLQCRFQSESISVSIQIKFQ